MWWRGFVWPLFGGGLPQACRSRGPRLRTFGRQRTICYDDAFCDESVVCGRGMEFTTSASLGGYELTYRSGDRIIPRVDGTQPVGLELQDVAQAIWTDGRAVSRAGLGLEGLMAMEAIDRSPVTLDVRQEGAVA